MNKYVQELHDEIKVKGIPVTSSKTNENVIWFKPRLKINEADLLLYINYDDESNIFVLMASELFHIDSVSIELFRVINDFNFDSRTFGCKMFIDEEGDILVNTSCVLESPEVVAQMNEYVSIMLANIDRYYNALSQIVGKLNAHDKQVEAEKAASEAEAAE